MLNHNHLCLELTFFRQARIRDLEKRIKDHTAGMVERRKQPKGTPQAEMEIARRELEIVSLNVVLAFGLIQMIHTITL